MHSDEQPESTDPLQELIQKLEDLEWRLHNLERWREYTDELTV